MCLREQITSASLSQCVCACVCVWITAHTEVLRNVNHCLGMQESPSFTLWKLNIFKLQRCSFLPPKFFFLPPPHHPLCRFIFHLKAKEEIANLSEDCVRSSGMRPWHSRTPVSRPKPPRFHPSRTHFPSHSGFSSSGWSAKYRLLMLWRAPPHPPYPKPHWQKLALEDIECEWKADGIEIETRSWALGYLARCIESRQKASAQTAENFAVQIIHTVEHRCWNLAYSTRADLMKLNTSSELNSEPSKPVSTHCGWTDSRQLLAKPKGCPMLVRRPKSSLRTILGVTSITGKII